MKNIRKHIRAAYTTRRYNGQRREANNCDTFRPCSRVSSGDKKNKRCESNTNKKLGKPKILVFKFFCFPKFLVGVRFSLLILLTPDEILEQGRKVSRWLASFLSPSYLRVVYDALINFLLFFLRI